jgi:prepilin-type N-terminal cleavage/methylation domain-containing protein
MKINIASKNNGRFQTGGFTLIEMIGVLAVIAILAALLIPKVTTAISDARTNSAVGSYQTIQTAAASHYSKYNAFNLTTNGVVIPGTSLLNYDLNVLLPEGLLDQPFNTKIGNGAVVQVVAGQGNAGQGYKLDGTNNLTANNAYTVEIVVSNVAPQDAFDVASRLDGSLAGTTAGLPLYGGRIVWNQASTTQTGATNMYMYVTGR